MADPREELLEGLATLARARHGDLEPERDRAERERLVRSLADGATRPLAALRPRWTLAAAALTLAAAAAVMISWPAQQLEYEVSGSEIAEQGYIRASQSEARIVFSEGTTITLAEGSVGRVVDVTDAGARMLLEHGRVHLEVSRRQGARWSVAAGPYSVEVTGTGFDVVWDPSAQHFEVELMHGSVNVRGPMVRDGVVMHPGQHLRADVAQRSLALDEPATPVPSAASAAAEASGHEPLVDRSAAPSAGEPVQVASAAQLRVPWSKRIAEGEFEIVLAEAEARGAESVLSSAGLGDVMALADAARYKGRQGLARRALESVRQRFGSSDAARTAAFLLGRMSEGAPAGAIAWYDTYLSEAPGGTFAAEALGRKMALLDRSGQRARARAVAEQYLASYPKGAYAALARQLRE